MYNIEIPQLIHQIIAVFYQLGLWDIKEKPTFWERGRKFFYFFYFALFGALLLVRAWVTSDKNERILLAMTGIEVVIQLSRMYFVIWRKDEMLTLIHHLGTHCTNDHNEFIKTENTLNKMIKFAQYLIQFSVVFLCATVIFPFATSQRELVVNVEIFVDWKNSRYGFWMVHALTECALFLSVVCFLFAIILWYLMLSLVIKYKLLGSEFRNLGGIKTTEQTFKVSKTEQQNVFRQDMIVAIKDHQQIDNDLDQFVLTFSKLFLLQIVTGSIFLCGSIYSLAYSSHENVVMDGIFCFIIQYLFFHIFAVMYLGNEIIDSTDELSYCLFESNWTEQPQSTKMLMITLTELIKKPKELIMGKLYLLNLATFTRIVDQAYSMFNILRNLRK